MTNWHDIKEVLVLYSSVDNPLESSVIHDILCRTRPGFNVETVRRVLRNLALAKNSGVYREKHIGRCGLYYLYWYQ